MTWAGQALSVPSLTEQTLSSVRNVGVTGIAQEPQATAVHIV